MEKKGAALKKKEAELQAREAKLERMLADVAKQRDLIKSADKELKEQEEAFRQQQLAAAARGVARTSALMSSIRLASDVSSRRSASGPAPAAAALAVPLAAGAHQADVGSLAFRFPDDLGEHTGYFDRPSRRPPPTSRRAA